MRLPGWRFVLVLVSGFALAGCDLLANRVTQPSDQGLAITRFTASSVTIRPGAAVTLSWEVVGADTVALDNGIGAVAAKGSREMRPAATTVYTLAAHATEAAAAASVRVTVR